MPKCYKYEKDAEGVEQQEPTEPPHCTSTPEWTRSRWDKKTDWTRLYKDDEAPEKDLVSEVTETVSDTTYGATQDEGLKSSMEEQGR